MGRKPTTTADTMYSLAQSSIEGMQIGDVKTITMPEDLAFFRKYLSEIAKRTQCKYTTKTLSNCELQIMRIKYYNIYSKKVE